MGGLSLLLCLGMVLASSGVLAQTPVCDSVLDLAFIVDSSGSIRDKNPTDGSYDNWNLTLKFITSMVKDLPISQDKTRVSVISYSNKANVHFFLNQQNSLAALQNAILNIPYIGSNTNTSGGLYVAKELVFNAVNGDRPDVPNVAIVITDGKSTYDAALTIPMAKALRSEKDVTVFAIGITAAVNKDEVEQISSEPQLENENYFLSTDFTKLEGIVDSIVGVTCNVVTTTAAYYERQIDLVFILDASSSTKNSDDFREILRFVASMVDQLHVSEYQTRVGVVAYSTFTQNIFYLNTYYSKELMKQAILGIQLLGLGSDMSKAVREVHEYQFTIANGARSGVPKYAILINDGSSASDVSGAIAEADLARSKGIELHAFVVAAINVAIPDYSRFLSVSKFDMESGKFYWRLPTYDVLKYFREELLYAVYEEEKTTVAPTAPAGTLYQADILFLIEAGSSIGPDNFAKILQFTSSVVDHIYVGYFQTRVGVVTYSDYARNVFFLNTFTDKFLMKDAISKATYMGGTSDLDKALKEVIFNQFSEINGARRAVDQHVVLITDGITTGEYASSIVSAVEANARGIKLLALGYGPLVDSNLLGAITYGSEGKTVYKMDRADHLVQYIDTITYNLYPSIVATSVPTRSSGCELSVADLVFVLDSSGSIRDANPDDKSYDNWNLLLTFVTRIVDKLNIGYDATRIGVVMYSDEGKSIFFLNTYGHKEDIKDAILNIAYIGSNTNTAAGIKEMHYNQFTADHGDRANIDNYVIIITDGVSTIANERTVPEAEAARDSGMKIFTVGITNGINEIELKDMSSLPQIENKNYFKSADFTLLDNILDALVTETCATEVPTVTPIPSCENSVADLVFVLDSSGSIRDHNPADHSYDNWNLLLSFVNAIIEKLSIGEHKTRVGVVRFSNNGESLVYLDSYFNKEELKNAILNINYMGSNTHTAAGLNAMHTEQFKYENGDRPDIPNYAIVITDGVSTINSESTIPEAIAARNKGVKIFAVGVTDAVKEVELKGISSPPQVEGQNYFRSTNFLDLDNIVHAIVSETCPIAVELGATGATGPDGESGSTGHTGPLGSTGNQGHTGPSGISGPEGSTGSTGHTGHAGATGQFGRPGATGSTGNVGETGRDGSLGSTGATGRQGRPGINIPGDTGSTGYIGRTGATGHTGHEGRDGLHGTSGLSGADGRPGSSGLIGHIGATGGTGQNGVTGKNGIDGKDGATGVNGLDGRTGATGSKGLEGETGASGKIGVDGKHGSTGATGLPGSTGEKGLEGETGATGIFGRDGSEGRTGSTGSSGIRGQDGKSGDTGLTGPRGRPGSTGSTGLQGRPGSDGRPGATGPLGSTGSSGQTGFTGSQGSVGRIGSTGATGPTGVTGTTGARGIPGRTGATGVTGFEGRAGASGKVGATGATGRTGRFGATGNTGENGITGRAGDTGHTGYTGFIGGQGRTGSTGSTGIGQTGGTGQTGQRGNTGFTGLSGVAGKSGATGHTGYTGGFGDTGATGARGVTGIPGRDGSAGATGNTGLGGRHGATGSRGVDGRVGSTGSTGFVGSKGSTGQTGFDGRTGSTGSTGRSGATGSTGRNGLDGRLGSTGVAGFPGRRGSTGSTGRDGRLGSTGTTGGRGATGFEGIDGIDGRLGSTGETGSPGRIGSTGNTGLQGNRGLSGHTGISGRIGSTGATGIVGRVGSTGTTGRAGITGQQGTTGRTGPNGRIGATGREGEVGRHGSTGNAGTTGRTGQRGSFGSTGVTGRSGIDGRSGAFGSTGFSGLEGKTGATGSTGIAGQTGTDGPLGATGSTGRRGVDGIIGATGSTGLNGRAGSEGIRGESGINGRQGSLGSTGFTGRQGFEGIEGKAGSTGLEGFSGRTGKTGSTGVQGRNGLIGRTGVDGRIGSTGRQGQFGGTGYTGETGFSGRFGAGGVTGLPGSSGLDGHDGRTGSTGSTGPQGVIGRVGSRGSTGRGLEGQTGATGTSGTRGVAGFDGRTGATGVTGESGFTGRIGSTGIGGRFGATGREGLGDTGIAGQLGREGVKGDGGLIGLPGPNGRDGERGAIGPAGRSIGTCQENECLHDNGGCEQICIDTYDSHFCMCNNGYHEKKIPIECPGAEMSCSSTVLDLVFVIDSSGSIRDNNPDDGSYDNWDLLLTFMTEMVEQLNIGETETRVGVVRYSNKGESLFYLNTFNSKQEIKDAITKISYIGSNTNTSGGLREMTANQFTDLHGDRADVDNVALVITDGVSTWDRARTVSDAEVARSRGIKIYTIGVTNAIDENELKLMSSEPQQKGTNYFTSASFQALNNVVNEVLRATCVITGSENLHCQMTKEADYQCFCDYGACDLRSVNGTQCADLNECAVKNGLCQHTCVNTEGSYYCECHIGHTLRADTTSCDDVNECLDNPCRAGQICANTYGSYYCLDTTGGVAAGLVGLPDTSLISSGTITLTTLVGAVVISAVIAIVSAVAVIMAIRLASRRKKTKALKVDRTEKVERTSAGFRGARMGIDNFGCSPRASTVEENC